MVIKKLAIVAASIIRRWCSTIFKVFSYRARSLSNQTSNLLSLTSAPCPPTSAFKNRLHNIGVSVREIKPEAIIAMLIVTANSRNNRPTIPPINSTGINTATRESVMETIVKPTSFEPFRAASNGFIPSSICRTIFSNITIASSTTKPTQRVSAKSDTLLMEKPRAAMPP